MRGPPRPGVGRGPPSAGAIPVAAWRSIEGMAKRVAVIGGSPTWRRGVDSALADVGLGTVEYATVTEWRPGRSVVAILVFIEVAGDLVDMSAVARDYPQMPFVVVTPDLGVTEFAASVRGGAVSAVAEDAPTDELTATVTHALAGRASVPWHLLRALASRVRAGFGETIQLGLDEQGYLRDLATGATVAELANATGYSEREMFRTLSELYARIAVRNRTEAIIWASRHGLLDEDQATG